MFVYVCLCLFMFVYVCLFVCLLACLFVCLFACLFVCLFQRYLISSHGSEHHVLHKILPQATLEMTHPVLSPLKLSTFVNGHPPVLSNRGVLEHFAI